MLATSESLLEPETRTEVRRRRGVLWAVVVVAALCGALWSFFPLPDAQARVSAVPKRGAQFQAWDLPLSEAEQAAFARVTLVHRRYAFKGHDFFVTVIDGTHDRHAVHDPRYCFQGAGWHVVDERKIALPGGEATLLTTEQAGEKAHAVFWFSDGARRHSSVLRFWWQTTLRRLTLGRSGAEPVIVTLQSYGPNQPDWSTAAGDVAKELGL
jgi:hypothetical protein